MANPELALAPSNPRHVSRRRIFLALLLALLVVLYLCQPVIFAWLLRREMISLAANRGLRLTPGLVEADLLEGKIKLANTVFADEFQPDCQVRIGLLEVRFSFLRALFLRDRPVVEELHLEKINAHWVLRPKTEQEFKINPDSAWKRWFPASITGTNLGGSLEWPDGRFEANGLEFVFHPGATGTIAAPKVSLQTAGWSRVFSNLSGVTAIKDRALYIGGVKFSDALQLELATLDFQNLAKARLTSDAQFSAFGGECRLDSQVDFHQSPALLDLAAEFWNISVQPLGVFAGNPALATGTLHDGRLTFRGVPADMAKASITLRLNATDFQWRERQWQSLVVSALLVDRRLDIPQFSLVQDKNQIEINGGMQLPDSWKKLPDHFQFNVQAQIDDLAQAATLLVPGQKIVAGEAFFAGTMGSNAGQFFGKLKMRGGPLTISGVAIDRVRGDLDLSGTEIKATNLELAHRDDLTTGWATFDFGGTPRYAGQFDLNAKNIADYQAILPAAAASHAVAGGAKIWWSGDGTADAHSGAFKISLDDFVLSRDPDAVPLDVESHGSYSPGGITLNHLRLARPDASIDALVVVRPDSLEIRDLQGTGKSGATLSASVVLPLNILAALQNPTLDALLDSQSPLAGHISGQKVQLGDFSELSGRRWPMRGRATFDLTTSGLLDQLNASASLMLEDFAASLNGTDYRVPQADLQWKIADHRLALNGKILPSPGSWAAGNLEAGLHLTRAALADGILIDQAATVVGNLTGKDFPIESLYAWLPFSRVFSGEIDGGLQLAGTPGAPQWTGKLQIKEGRWQTDFLAQPLKRLTGNFAIVPDGLQWTDLAGEYRGGKFSIKGQTGFSAAADLNLDLQISDLPLSEDRGWQATLDGSVALSGPAASRKLTGAMLLKKAFANRDLLFSTEAPIADFSLPWMPPDWSVDLQLRSEGAVEAVGTTTHWKLTPDLQVTGTGSQPLFQGTIAVRETTPGAGREGVINYLSTAFEHGWVDFSTAPVGLSAPVPSGQDDLQTASPPVEPSSSLHPQWRDGWP